MRALLFCAALLVAAAISEVKSEKIVFCYVGTWAYYYPGNGQFNIENIDPTLCTHLAYAFFGVAENGAIQSLDNYLDYDQDYGVGQLKKFNALKSRNSNLKTIISVGGWSEGSDKFSRVAADSGKRSTFISSAVSFLYQYGFNGLDLDWEYPGQRGGSSNDYQNYITFLREIKQEFNNHGFMLSAAVAASSGSASQSYNIPEMSKYLDLINVMTYDFHGSWDSVTGENAPMYASSKDYSKDLNVDASINYWLSQGAPANKLVMGVPFYGHTFTLQDSNNNGVGAPITGDGRGGPYTQQDGYMGYNEACESFSRGGWNFNWENTQQVPYANNGNQWIGYDDPGSLGWKTQYINNKNLAGAMIWSIENDDFRGNCGSSWPLLMKLNQGLGRR